ncbi:hypothetical protein, partial [uncultured Akkermansia sp.]|uniref:hypothetical protein n=1 Tax=uncultured Akkermansia sp. TaxID=512294 RepID=UPI002626E1F1
PAIDDSGLPKCFCHVTVVTSVLLNHYSDLVSFAGLKYRGQWKKNRLAARQTAGSIPVPV